MGLPIVTALFGIGCGIASCSIAAHGDRHARLHDRRPSSMIGIGVGHRLRAVHRHALPRGLHAGLDPRTRSSSSLDTAGRAVLFAGTTVVISLLGLLLHEAVQHVRGVAVGDRRSACSRRCSRRSRCCPRCSGSSAATSTARPPAPQAGRGHGSRDVLVPVEPGAPAPPVAARCSSGSSCSCCSPSRVFDAPRVRRRRQPRRRPTRPAGPTTCCSRASGPASTARCCSRPRRRAGPPTLAVARRRCARDARTGTPGVAFVDAAAVEPGRRRRDHAGVPDDVAAGRGDSRPRRTACATT